MAWSNFTLEVINVNDPPVISEDAPASIEVIAGEDYILDFTPFVSDVDNDTEDLILTTDSDYARVDGLVITFNYPATVSSENVTLTLSDGIDSTSWSIQVTVVIPTRVQIITMDFITVMIYFTGVGDITINVNVTPPGPAPENMTGIGVYFDITVTTDNWVWLYITVDYSGFNISAVNETTFALYYWNGTAWALCENTGIDLAEELIYANITHLTVFAVFGERLPDSDRDGIPDELDHDDDNDLMPDLWELTHGLEPFANDSASDKDEDGLTNLEEYILGSSPALNDTDFDGMQDLWEHEHGLKLTIVDADADPDDDGFSNIEEYNAGTDPNDAESYPVEKKAPKPKVDYTAVYIAIAVIIVVFVLLLVFMRVRRKKRELLTLLERGAVEKVPEAPEDADQEEK
jgi:hypothetical protein